MVAATYPPAHTRVMPIDQQEVLALQLPKMPLEDVFDQMRSLHLLKAWAFHKCCPDGNEEILPLTHVVSGWQIAKVQEGATFAQWPVAVERALEGFIRWLSDTIVIRVQR